MSRDDELESYRATLPARTPDGDLSTVIVTRRGLGARERTWVTLDGARKTTVVMTRELALQLIKQLGQAARC